MNLRSSLLGLVVAVDVNLREEGEGVRALGLGKSLPEAAGSTQNQDKEAVPGTIHTSLDLGIAARLLAYDPGLDMTVT